MVSSVRQLRAQRFFCTLALGDVQVDAGDAHSPASLIAFNPPQAPHPPFALDRVQDAKLLDPNVLSAPGSCSF